MATAATKPFRNLEEINPIFTIDVETNIVISKNADLTMVFALDLSEIFTMSEDNYTAIHTSYTRALKVFQPGYMVHKQDIFLEGSFLAPLLNQHTQTHFIQRENERHFSERPVLDHKSYIYITLPSSSPLKRTSANSSLFKRHLVPKELKNPKVWQGFRELCLQFQAILNDSSLVNCKQLTYPDLVGKSADFSRAGLGLYHHYLQLNFDDPTLRDISCENGFNVGGKFCHTYAITDLAEVPSEIAEQVRVEQLSSDKSIMSVSTGSMFGLYMPFNHVYNQVLYFEYPDELVNRLTGEIKRHISFSAWSQENEVSVTEKNGFIAAMKGQSRTVVKAHYNITVFHQDSEVADDYRARTSASLSKLGFRPKLATFDAEPLFWACIPGNIAELGAENLFTCFLEEAVALWCMETNYKDPAYKKGGIQLTDRFGRPVMVDLIVDTYPDTITNRNMLLVGPSGTGKSFATNNMVYYLRQAGVHVNVVDIGGSYKRLSGVLNGKYITVDDTNRLEFNPFYFENLSPDEDQQDALRTLLNVLWKGDELMNNSENSGVAPLVTSYYAYLRAEHARNNFLFPCMNSFFEYTEEVYTEVLSNSRHWTEDKFDVSSFLWNLEKFYGDNQYGYLLNSTKNVDLISDPFTVFELDNIKDNKTLYAVVTMMIMNIYVNKLFSKTKDIKVLIIEEAWQALSQPNFGSFLLWCVKTCRKHHGSLIVVTQEVDDLLKSTIVKEALVKNCAIKILMDQSAYSESFDPIKEVLGLTEANANIILSINGAKDYSRPPYKEMAIIMDKQVKVYGVEVCGHAYAAFTTNKDQVLELKALEAVTGSTEEAITAWVDGVRVAVSSVSVEPVPVEAV